MISVSLPFLIGCSVVISTALMWLNVRGAGVFGAAGATLSVCIAIVIIQFIASGSAALTRQEVQFWVLFVLLPSALVLAVSRLAILQARPLRLLFIGPVTFVVAVAAVMVTYNILLASVRSE